MPYEFIDEPQQETGLGTLARGVARTGARVGEAIVGLPGDIASGVLGLGNVASQFATGSKIPGVENIQQYLPTSEAIKQNVTKKITGEYLEPKGDVESTLDTLAGDIATLLTPGGIASKGASLTGKAIGKAALRAAGAGIVGKVATEYIGPEAGALAKGLTLGLSNTAGGRKALSKITKESYAAAEQAIPTKAVTSGIALRSKLANDIKTISKGVAPNKDEMLKILTQAQSNISKKGTIPVRDLWNLKRNVNDWIFNEKLDSSSKFQLKKTVGDLNKELSRYAEKNPSFGQNFIKGEEIYRAMHDASNFRKAIEKNVNIQKIANNFTPLSIAGSGLTYILGLSKGVAGKGAAGALAGAFGTREFLKLKDLITKSKEARNYYLNAIKSGAAGDTAAFSKNLRAFDQVAVKEEQNKNQQSKYEFID